MSSIEAVVDCLIYSSVDFPQSQFSPPVVQCQSSLLIGYRLLVVLSCDDFERKQPHACSPNFRAFSGTDFMRRNALFFWPLSLCFPTRQCWWLICAQTQCACLDVLSLSQPIGTVIGATCMQFSEQPQRRLPSEELCRFRQKNLPTNLATAISSVSSNTTKGTFYARFSKCLHWLSFLLSSASVCLLCYWLLRDLRHYFSCGCDHTASSETVWRYNELPTRNCDDCLTARQLLPDIEIALYDRLVWWVPQLLWPQIDFLADGS